MLESAAHHVPFSFPGIGHVFGDAFSRVVSSMPRQCRSQTGRQLGHKECVCRVLHVRVSTGRNSRNLIQGAGDAS